MITVGSLFAGIGGLELGLERAGMQVRWQVEIDGYCRKVLEKHWPDVKRYEDVREVGSHNLEPVDLICGGFPCQDISSAGKRAGIEGERSGLWSEFYRIICELRPRYVLVENVAALLDDGIGRILGDLAESGFDAEWQMLRASDFTLPHRRQRVFVVAYANEVHGKPRLGTQPGWPEEIFRGDLCQCLPVRVQAADCFIGVDDGVSASVYRERVGALGNAVVPQVAEWIGRLIVEAHERSGAR